MDVLGLNARVEMSCFRISFVSKVLSLLPLASTFPPTACLSTVASYYSTLLGWFIFSDRLLAGLENYYLYLARVCLYLRVHGDVSVVLQRRTTCML